MPRFVSIEKPVCLNAVVAALLATAISPSRVYAHGIVARRLVGEMSILSWAKRGPMQPESIILKRGKNVEPAQAHK